MADLARRLEAGYKALQAQQPEHKEYASAASLDDLRFYEEEGLLFDVVVDGTRSGVVAPYRDVDKGMAGFQVGEVFLSEP